MNSKKFVALLFFLSFLSICANNNVLLASTVTISRVQTATDQSQIAAVKGLVSRNLPLVQRKFAYKIIPREDGHDVFEVKSQNGNILLSGSSGVAMSVGLNWYLREVCNKQLSWCGSNMELTEADLLPIPNGSYRRILPHEHNVYLNYCTLSYSMAWWDWKRWQWEIDFMALNGINMPLSVVGVEAVWYNALLRVGITDAEARQFLVAPCHFAWQWMQNIENPGSPLPLSWIKSHIKLGKQILNSQRAFGMTPIQQGFSGYVPSIFSTKFPTAKIRKQPRWCNYEGVSQLDPLDPLFKQFGRIFLEEESKLFGLSGYYAADPFHESEPPADITKEELPKYLNLVGETIHELFNSVDSTSTWVMQSWSIRKDIAISVPKGRLLVIDLAGSKWKSTNGFWGHNFCVGQLHNFGNRINLHGDLKSIVDNPFMNAKMEYPATAVGTGLFPEGIVQNPVFYDCYFEVISRDEKIDIDQWLIKYCLRRYGRNTDNTTKAWQLLKNGPYKKGTNGVESSSIVAARPALNCKKSGPNDGFNVPYSKSDLITAWGLLLDDKKLLADKSGYQFDVVDVGRQSLSNYAQDLQKEIKIAFEKKDIQYFKIKTAQFVDLLNDIDLICDTRSEYRFSDWVNSAKKWGKNKAEKDFYDKDASMLVTYWGPKGSPEIFDYSWREWSGLIHEFYIPRWKFFFEFLTKKLDKGEDYSEVGLQQVYDREAWRANDFYNSLADWEEKWVETPKNYTPKVSKSTDAVKISSQLYSKWKPIMEGTYNTNN